MSDDAQHREIMTAVRAVENIAKANQESVREVKRVTYENQNALSLQGEKVNAVHLALFGNGKPERGQQIRLHDLEQREQRRDRAVSMVSKAVVTWIATTIAGVVIYYLTRGGAS